jgi:predicted AAA+ superfamily ATPase
MYINRSLEDTVLQIQESFPVLLLTGPRQVGKTTMLQRLAGQDRRYVTLDDPFQRELAVSDPALFLQRYAPPVFIDEIQYAPELLPYIKMYVDKKRRNGDFWLIGSQMFHLLKKAGEAVAGRVGIVNMLGLSNREIAGEGSAPFSTNPEDLRQKLPTSKPLAPREIFALIQKGGMPALYAGQNINPDKFYSSYIQTYLQKDIRGLAQVSDELAFVRFLACVAARTGQVVNYADMARDTGISPPTAKQWLSVLVSSGLVALVEPYVNESLKRMIKSPKIYFLDTGLCAYLTKWPTPEALEAGDMSGAFFESWVLGEILKSYYNAGQSPLLYYYRDKDQKEIDLILYENYTLYPIEIKKSAKPPREAARHFRVLHNRGILVGNGSVICLAKELSQLDNNNWFVPAWLI